MGTGKIGIGMVGYGGIGPLHAMAYRSIPLQYGLEADAVRMVGVATRHRETAQQAASEAGCDFWTADYRELLSRDDVDVVAVLVPNNKHEEIVVAAAEAGKHLYCEKPLALNPAEGERMVAAVKANGVKAQMGFNFRFYPALMRAKQLMEADSLGRVFSFRACFYRSSYINYDKPLSWRLRKEIAGGGALFDLGSHILDLVRHLLGDFDSILATLDTMIGERPVAKGASRTGGVDVDDVAMIQTRMTTGALGTVEVSRLGTGVANKVAIEIYGDRGALCFDSCDPSWLYYYDVADDAGPIGGKRGFRRIETVGHYEDRRVPHWTMPPGFVGTFTEGHYRLLKAIWEDEDASPNLFDGLRVQQAMEAAQVSSQERRWVSLDD